MRSEETHTTEELTAYRLQIMRAFSELNGAVARFVYGLRQNSKLDSQSITTTRVVRSEDCSVLFVTATLSDGTETIFSLPVPEGI